ncbi:MAG TPA: DUF669 domain-containing protein [Phycisphaerales bacterium]|nr:DUF669 domain-containing protein [Phycisphaerales bacterium]
MANLNFNAHDVDPTTDFEPIPAGKYVAVITASEMKPTKRGDGAYLELTFQVIEGEFKNRLLWARLNLDNPNPLTVKIARSELSALCRAVGVMEPKDSCELHNLPLAITVKQKTDADGELRNEVKGYAKRETAGGGAKPAQNANATPPWRRG